MVLIQYNTSIENLNIAIIHSFDEIELNRYLHPIEKFECVLCLIFLMNFVSSGA